MSTVKNIFLAVVLYAFSYNLVHSSNTVPSKGDYLPSLDWQRVNLEDGIRRKVEGTLSKVIKSKEYIVDVQIVVNPPRKPRFTPTDDPANAESVKKEKAGIDGVRINDILPEKLPKDYIVFSKLGLEAPLVDDFNDFKKDKDSEEKDKDKTELPTFEQLWKFNKSLDVFNNLEAVKIYIQLSNKLHIDTRNTVNRVLNSLNYNLNDIKPSLSISYINMEEKLNATDLLSSEFMQFLERFENTIGIVVAALILGLFAWLLFSRWEKLQQEKSESELSGGTESHTGPEDDEEKLIGGEGPFGEDGLLASKGIERFESFLEHSKNEAILMIKRWLNSKGDKEIQALRALVQQLGNEKLLVLFNSLKEDERDYWKDCLGKPLGEEQLKKANAFISNEIVSIILVPSEIVDAEAADLLLKMNPESAAKFVKDDPALGKILMNTMSNAFVSKILENMEEDEIDTAITSSLTYQKDQIDESMLDFKGKLAQYQETVKTIPFVGKMIDLIKISTPESENVLFKSLSQNVQDVKRLKEIVLETFPAVLIEKLPEEILKSILHHYPMVKRVELVSAVDEQKRDLFINLFAPDGSKAADVLELEIEKVHSDPKVMRKITDEPEKIWAEFVVYARNYISKDKENQYTYENLISVWVSSIVDGIGAVEAASRITIDDSIDEADDIEDDDFKQAA